MSLYGYLAIVACFFGLVWFIFRSGEKKAELKSSNNRLDNLLKVKKWQNNKKFRDETEEMFKRK